MCLCRTIIYLFAYTAQIVIVWISSRCTLRCSGSRCIYWLTNYLNSSIVTGQICLIAVAKCDCTTNSNCSFVNNLSKMSESVNKEKKLLHLFTLHANVKDYCRHYAEISVGKEFIASMFA